MKEIKDRLAGIISEICGVEKEAISNDVSLLDDIGITSVTFVETMATIEQEFGIVLKDSDYNIEKYTTIGDLVELVENNIK
jgi:acyl carrier protein